MQRLTFGIRMAPYLSLTLVPMYHKDEAQPGNVINGG